MLTLAVKGLPWFSHGYLHRGNMQAEMCYHSASMHATNYYNRETIGSFFISEINNNNKRRKLKVVKEGKAESS